MISFSWPTCQCCFEIMCCFTLLFFDKSDLIQLHIFKNQPPHHALPRLQRVREKNVHKCQKGYYKDYLLSHCTNRISPLPYRCWSLFCSGWSKINLPGRKLISDVPFPMNAKILSGPHLPLPKKLSAIYDLFIVTLRKSCTLQQIL